jgi:hypothetical protein
MIQHDFARRTSPNPQPRSKFRAAFALLIAGALLGTTLAAAAATGRHFPHATTKTLQAKQPKTEYMQVVPATPTTIRKLNPQPLPPG